MNRAEQAVTIAKGEIVRDVVEGVVPASVAKFSELHDHVDANEYGAPGLFTRGPLFWVDDVDFWNQVQGELDEWIRGGALRGIAPRFVIEDIDDGEDIDGNIDGDSGEDVDEAQDRAEGIAERSIDWDRDTP